LPDLGQAYKNTTARRQSSAHVANFLYNYQWLAAIKHEVLTIAAALDILLEARCWQVDSLLTINVQDHDIEKALNYRFLQEDTGVFKETKKLVGSSLKNWKSVSDAVLSLRPSLISSKEFLVVLDKNRRVSDWYVM